MPQALPHSHSLPALWHEPAPFHVDQAIPWWIKAGLIVIATVIAILFLDQHIAAFARHHPIANLAPYGALDPADAGKQQSANKLTDLGRELMWLEQWGQGICSVIVIAAVALIDRNGRRRALSIAIGCLLTLALTHLLKDLCGRSRPFVAANSADGSWVWGGPSMGFTKGSSWGSFPSAHTTAAFALAAGLSWFYPRGRALFMILALITATLRVLHTAHYASDVIVGMGIGVMVTRWSLSTKCAGRILAFLPPSLQRWWAPEA